MKRTFLLILLTAFTVLSISACKEEDKVVSTWDSTSMTMTDGTSVDIKYQMLMQVRYDSKFKTEFYCLSKRFGTEWNTDYYVLKDNMLYESKYCPLKYIIKVDSVTGHTKSTKNALWQSGQLSIETEPSYSLSVKESILELATLGDDITTYQFAKSSNSIAL